LLIVPLSWKWGLVGAAWAIFLNEIVVLSYSLYVNVKILGSVRPTFSPTILRRLISVGFPITVIWWTYMLQTTVDRLMSMWMLGKEATGYYGLGASIVAALVLIPMVVGRVLYPKVNEEVGKDADRLTLEAYVVAPARALALVLPPLIGVLIILVPDLYRIVFVKYLPGAQSAQILLAGAYFACLIRSGVNYLVAIDKQNGVLAIVGASLSVNVILSFILVKAGLGINGIAIGMTVSCLALTSLLWKSVFVQLGFSGRNQALRLFHLYLPFCICIVFAGGLAAARYWTHAIASLTLDLVAAALFVLVYGISVFFVPPLDAWSKDITARIRPVLLSARKRLGALAAR
jgi:O-antigen/teichoic acid export membrane protein